MMAKSTGLMVSAIAIVALAAADRGLAGYALYDDLVWGDNQEALVIARIVDDGSRPIYADSIGGNAWAMLEPLAVLAGNLDPSATRSFKVTFYADGPYTPPLPRKGAMIMAVVKENDFIISDGCKFMPDSAPLVVINGLGDRRVTETIDRLRKVRLAVPASQPATQPAGRK